MMKGKKICTTTNEEDKKGVCPAPTSTRPLPVE
jgi:hypothetical protein